MSDQYNDRQQQQQQQQQRDQFDLEEGANPIDSSGQNNEEFNEENTRISSYPNEYEYDERTVEETTGLNVKKRSNSFDKKKRKFKPQPSSNGSPYTQSILTQSNQTSKMNSFQASSNRNMKNNPGESRTNAGSGQHVPRQQAYHYQTNNEQDYDDDDDNQIDNEDENDDDQDESYPLSPHHQQQQQLQSNQFNRSGGMQQHKLNASKSHKIDGHVSKGNTMNSTNSINNLGQGGSRPNSHNTSQQPPYYQSALKHHHPTNNSSVKTNNMMTHGISGYDARIADDKIDLWGHLLIGISYFFLVFSFPFSLCACVKVAQEYERAVIFRLGRILQGGAKGPGIFFVLPCIDTYTKVDLRTVTFDVPPQEILTKDSVTVSVDAVVYFRIFNAVISVINVEDAAKSTKLLAASTLRNILGTKSLHEILSDRESVAILIQNNLDEATGPCKDVRLPVQLQRAMATEAEAAREARAKVIAAEGEQKASKALKEAAEVISESPIAIQLRYLQTLTQIASEKNSTIVFPIPLEMLSFLANKSAALFKTKT